MTEPQQPKTIKDLQTDKWHQLSPIAILHFAIKFLFQSFQQGLQSLLPALAVAVTFLHNQLFLVIVLLLVLGLLLTAAAFMGYLKFRYRLSSDSVLIQRGVLTRKRLSISFDRIQNITIREPIYFRPFGLVALSIESAGSSAEEVSLAGIEKQLAEEIRRLVLRAKTTAPDKAHFRHTNGTNSDQNGTECKDVPTPVPTEAKTLLRQPISELIRYGLSNNNIWIFASLIIAAIAQVNWKDYAFTDTVAATIIDMTGGDKLIIGLLFSTGIITFILSLMMISAIGAIVLYYDYHLTSDKRQLHQSKGLFERQETSLSKSKIQCLRLNKPWPARLFNRHHITIKQIGFNEKSAAANTKKAFIIPSCPDAFTKQLSEELYPSFNWNVAQLQSISSYYTRRIVVWFIVPLSLITALCLSFSVGNDGMLALLAPFFAWPIIARRTSMYGYYTDTQHALIRTGFIGHKLTVFPLYKAQVVEVKQSPGQRRKQLATLTIKLAGTTLKLPYIPMEDAKSWRDTILYCVETSKKPWM
ncbi:PH domain-containing protein [Kordiimonas pumila]|uniref:PH domain-containing protein n=1 Tax=Kordiimonas pumila TaxID=2161677 RepID=A0ABV7D7I1_9PROT|nr:PH domain-containing protein [Kordiimonas pumila]